MRQRSSSAAQEAAARRAPCLTGWCRGSWPAALARGRGSQAAGSAVGGIVYDAKGLGGALIVAGVIAAVGLAAPAQPRRSGYQRSASRLARSSPRAGLASALAPGVTGGAGNGA